MSEKTLAIAILTFAIQDLNIILDKKRLSWFRETTMKAEKEHTLNRKKLNWRERKKQKRQNIFTKKEKSEYRVLSALEIDYTSAHNFLYNNSPLYKNYREWVCSAANIEVDYLMRKLKEVHLDNIKDKCYYSTHAVNNGLESLTG